VATPITAAKLASTTSIRIASSWYRLASLSRRALRLPVSP
jgi:hypothetical protein